MAIIPDEYLENDTKYKHAVNSYLLRLKEEGVSLEALVLNDTYMTELSDIYFDAREASGCNDNNMFEDDIYTHLLKKTLSKQDVLDIIPFYESGCKRDINVHILFALSMKSNIVFEARGNSDMKWFTSVAKKLGYYIHIVYVCASANILQYRIRERVRERYENLKCIENPPVRIPPYDMVSICSGLNEIAKKVDIHDEQSDKTDYYFFKENDDNEMVGKKEFVSKMLQDCTCSQSDQ